MIKRYYLEKVAENLKPNKALVIYGPRQVGKTTLVNDFLKEFKGSVFRGSGEDSVLKNILESGDFNKIINMFSGYDLIFIDEAQKVLNIGQALKIIVDQIKGAKVIATGSSSFDLANKIGEPLVGRKITLNLFPVSALELVENYGRIEIEQRLEDLLI